MGAVTTDPKILMLAGEHSGDLLGGELIRELKKTFPTWKPSG
ncbi:lipid-A-disaccharide synthetase-like protein [Leptospira interrogans serovar Bataviae str. HAI135]|nr:lipid-A-disaccharide synthetase-like protein [Leptospira interrogans serovar Bataviae str. HAI135]